MSPGGGGKVTRRRIALISVLAVLSVVGRADDTFMCCMSGMKSLRGVSLCVAPCCPGYREEVERSSPLLGPVISCRKDSAWRARRGRKLPAIMVEEKNKEGRLPMIYYKKK